MFKKRKFSEIKNKNTNDNDYIITASTILKKHEYRKKINKYLICCSNLSNKIKNNIHYQYDRDQEDDIKKLKQLVNSSKIYFLKNFSKIW